MPAIKCPIPGCDYSTDDVDATIVVQLLQLHQVAHVQPQGSPTSAAKVEKAKDHQSAYLGQVKNGRIFVPDGMNM